MKRIHIHLPGGRREGRTTAVRMADVKTDAENFAEGMERVYQAELEAKRKFPKGSRVRFPNGEIARVTGHNGVMIHTDRGDVHHTKAFAADAKTADHCGCPGAHVGGDPDAPLKAKDGMSSEYAAALEESNKASAAYRKVQEDYRARRIGDREYLAARKVYEEAQRKFDVAFSKEQARTGDGSRTVRAEGKTYLLDPGLELVEVKAGTEFLGKKYFAATVLTLSSAYAELLVGRGDGRRLRIESYTRDAATQDSDMPLPAKPEDGQAVYSDPEGDHMKVEKKRDGSFYGAANKYDVSARTEAEMRAKLRQWKFRYIGWE